MAALSSAPAAADLQALIVAEALAWRGTPYHHQQSVKGVGSDCLGLVRGVWRAVIGPEPVRAPNYSRDWAESAGRETMLEGFGFWLAGIPIEAARAGDVLAFRMKPGAPAKHCGVLVSDDRFVHAFEGAASAVVSRLDDPTPLRGTWRRKIAAAFRFPGA